MEQKEISLSEYNQSFYIKAIETTIIALVVLLPIVFYPWCITIFGPAKLVTAEVLIILGLMFWGLKMISKVEIKFTYTPLNLPILCFIVICILSLIWSNSFFVSLKELPLFLAGSLLYFTIINNIISNILMFMRPDQMPDFKPVDLCNILDDSLFFSRHIIKSNSSIEVIKRYASTSLMMPADSELLKQMSLNIILNAIQAMPDGGTLRVSCIKVANDNDKERDWVEIRFADTGTGISKEDMPKIFDPFFTTKKKGTGLGMSIVNNIINVHGGTIKINSSKS